MKLKLLYGILDGLEIHEGQLEGGLSILTKQMTFHHKGRRATYEYSHRDGEFLVYKLVSVNIFQGANI